MTALKYKTGETNWWKETGLHAAHNTFSTFCIAGDVRASRLVFRVIYMAGNANRWLWKETLEEHQREYILPLWPLLETPGSRCVNTTHPVKITLKGLSDKKGIWMMNCEWLKAIGHLGPGAPNDTRNDQVVLLCAPLKCEPHQSLNTWDSPSLFHNQRNLLIEKRTHLKVLNSLTSITTITL